MNTLKNCKRGEMKRIELETGVNYNTLKDWKRKLTEDPKFTSCHLQIRPNKRLFTIYEENNIANYIKEEIIKLGYFFCNDDFRGLIMNAYLEKYSDSEDIKPFNASDGYINDFKTHHRISRRRRVKVTFKETFVNKNEKLKKRM